MLWEILYADDAGIVSRSPEGLEKMMTAIVAGCAAFVLTVSEAKTEIMCLQTKGGGGTCRSPLLQPARCTKQWSRLCTWAGRSAQIETSEVSE